MPRKLVWVHSQVQEIHLQTSGRRANWERGPVVGGVPQRRTEPLWGWRALRAASSLETRSQTLIDLFRLHPGQCLHLTLWLGAKGAQGLEAPHPAYSTERFFFFLSKIQGRPGTEASRLMNIWAASAIQLPLQEGEAS